MHGGLSTGPTTAEGLEHSRKARWKHGGQSREAKQSRVARRQDIHEIRSLMKWAMQACSETYKKPRKI